MQNDTQRRAEEYLPEPMILVLIRKVVWFYNQLEVVAIVNE